MNEQIKYKKIPQTKKQFFSNCKKDIIYFDAEIIAINDFKIFTIIDYRTREYLNFETTNTRYFKDVLKLTLQKLKANRFKDIEPFLKKDVKNFNKKTILTKIEEKIAYLKIETINKINEIIDKELETKNE